MKDNKYIGRFAAGVVLCAYAYCGINSIIDLASPVQNNNEGKPYIYLTSGEVIDPATAPQTTKFDKKTAKDFATMLFEDSEEAPDLNEFLSRFTCNTCGKGCLLASPFCFVGQGNKDLAIEVYQEMYPEVELF